MFKYFLFWLKIFSFIFLLLLFGIAYLIFYYSLDLPDYEKLKEYYPPSSTRIYSSDLVLMEEYAREKRVFVPLSSVPNSLIEAFIAAEDKNFYNHMGVDFSSIFRAAYDGIFKIAQNKRVSGGSTITQQVAKNFLLSSERTITRKIKEAILAYKMSNALSKKRILELYLNQIYLGKSSYGVASAALIYFDKSVEDLNLVESAFIAGLPKAPSAFDPDKNYQKAFARKNYVIQRMHEDGYISDDAAKKAIETPIKIKKGNIKFLHSKYYAEKVRQEVVDILGEEALYTGGLTVITCMDSELQKKADEALKKGIEDFEKGKFRKVANIKSINEIDKFGHDAGMVISASGQTTEILKKSGKKLKIKKLNLKIGDVIYIDDFGKPIPKINGGFIALDPKDGKIIAMSGGYNFELNKFNRATQAMRQPGSVFKTFVYLAALESDISKDTLFSDSPISISQGPGLPLWQPKNYKGDFLGEITMQRGYELSRNLVTIRVALEVGIEKIAELSDRLNIYHKPKQNLSIVLGAFETSLEKITTAYGMIINGGYEIRSKYIELIKDKDGKILYKRDTGGNYADKKKVLDSEVAKQMTEMMLGVVERGTATRALNIKAKIGGKTGTTNDSKDVWFIGFSSNLVVGTYMGYDDPKPLGKSVTGASNALPIFIDFMQKTLELKPEYFGSIGNTDASKYTELY